MISFMLKKVLNYFFKIKLLKYNKKIIAILTKIQHVVGYVQVIIITYKKIQNNIILDMFFDSLYHNFEITIAHFLYFINKNL